MIFAVAGERANTSKISGARVTERSQAGGGRDVVRVEIDQVLRVRDAVRIVAGRAGGFLIDHMKTMAAILSLTVESAKTLIAQDALTAVAFVAQRFVGRAFWRVIGEHQLALEQRRINRAVRTIRAGAAGCDALITVVTVRASHEARSCPRRNQTGHVVIFSDGFNRVK